MSTKVRYVFEFVIPDDYLLNSREKKKKKNTWGVMGEEGGW